MRLQALQRLERWFQNRGFRIDYDRKKYRVFAIDFVQQKIEAPVSRPKISANTGLLLNLLHEAGHLYQRVPLSSREKLGLGYTMHGSSGRTKASKIDILHEELEAWHVARDLAKALKVPVSQREWSLLRSKNIQSYAKWLLEPGFRQPGSLQRPPVRARNQ